MGRAKKSCSNEGHKQDQNSDTGKRYFKPAEAMKIPKDRTNRPLKDKKGQDAVNNLTCPIHIKVNVCAVASSDSSDRTDHRKDNIREKCRVLAVRFKS